MDFEANNQSQNASRLMTRFVGLIGLEGPRAIQMQSKWLEGRGRSGSLLALKLSLTQF